MSSEIEGRVERVISEFRQMGIEPAPETVAEIMVDQDVSSNGQGISRPDAVGAFAEYSKAAARSLRGDPPNAPFFAGGIARAGGVTGSNN